jgi:hypothetical protein
MKALRHDQRLMALALVLLTVLGGGCSGLTSSGDKPGVKVASDQRDLVGTWYDAKGEKVPDGTNEFGGILVLAAGAGSTTCSMQDVTVFMELAWPPGRRLDWTAGYEAEDTNRYIRQTLGSGMATDGQSDLAADLPDAARSTGLNKEGNFLYAIESKPAAIWVQRPDRRVERWARLKCGQGCA